MSPIGPFIASILVKASLLLAVAAAADALLRRRTSAASRHLLWTLTVAALLLLPALSTLLPGWSVPMPMLQASAPAIATPVTVATPAPTVVEAPAVVPVGPTRDDDATPIASTHTMATPAPPPTRTGTVRMPWSSVLLMVYAAGVLVLLVRLGLQRVAVRRLVRQAVEVSDTEWTRLFAECAQSLRIGRMVRLLRSRERTMPMTFGTRRPAILLPAIADTWSLDRRRAVLLHELAHVARFDCLTQGLATVACAVYWVHPGVWWAARRLHAERELACDDRVITAGTQARDYAGHLLEIAYSLGGGRAPALVVTMARPRQLEGRMLAVLDESRNRETPRPRSRMAAGAITAALVLPLAALEGSVPSTASSTAARLDATRTELDRVDSMQIEPPQQPAQPGQLPQSGQLAQLAQLAHSAPQDALPPAQALAEPERRPLPEPETQAQLQPQAQARRLNKSLQPTLFGRISALVSTMLADNAPVAPAAPGAPAGAAVAGAAGVQDRGQDRLPGTWEIRPTNDPTAGTGLVHLQLTEISRDGGHWSTGNNVPVDRLEGLTQAQLTGAGGPVSFRIRRDAGTFSFSGVFQSGVGAGTYSFAPDPAFPDQLARRGIGRPTAEQQYNMARADVGLAFLDELNAQGYQRPDIDELVRAAQHGVGLDYLRDMGGLGYRLGLLEALIRQRDHGVTARYIRELANDGFTHLSPDDLIRTRDHGVSAEYLRGMRDAGYRGLSLEQAINARDHGISVEYVKEMAGLGYSSLTLDELINARNHGVSAPFAQEMKALGYPMNLSEMMRARDHGVSAEYVKEMSAAGFGKLSLDTLIDARNQGVSAEYANEMKALGYQFALDDLIKARNQGVSAEYVKEMAAAGYARLSLDTLVKARNHGISAEYAREMKALGYDLSLEDLVRARDHGVRPEDAKSLKSLGYDRPSLDDLIMLRDHGVTAERIRKANERAGAHLPLDLIKSLADGGLR